MPFDGEIVAIKIEGNPINGERLQETVDTDITPSHFQTCPDYAKIWRRDR